VPVTLLLHDDGAQQIAQRVLSFLANKFQISMQLISGCFKFIESDIFVYVSNFKLVYLIFVDHLAYIKEVSEHPSSSQIDRTNQEDSRIER
jgi:hypothetical protein